MSERKRVNIFIPEHMHQWFKQRSNEIGVSVSGLMCLALEQHIIEREAISNISSINELISNQKKENNVEKKELDQNEES